MFRLDNGAVGVVESVWHLPETTPYQIDAWMEVIGTEGALYINCGEAGLTIHVAAGNKMPDTIYWPRLFGQRWGGIAGGLRYFADYILAGKPPDRITPQESREAAQYLADRLGIAMIELVDPVGQDFCIDITKAKYQLGYRPQYDIFGLIDHALEFRRSGRPRRKRSGYRG